MNYSEMSDFEVDKAVAEIIFSGLKVTNFAGEAVVWDEKNNTRIVRYCNSWTDAGPIIQRHKISLIWVKTEIPNRWDAGSPCHMKWATHEYNPLRAAMETFLLMQERPDAA